MLWYSKTSHSSVRCPVGLCLYRSSRNHGVGGGLHSRFATTPVFPLERLTRSRGFQNALDPMSVLSLIDSTRLIQQSVFPVGSLALHDDLVRGTLRYRYVSKSRSIFRIISISFEIDLYFLGERISIDIREFQHESALCELRIDRFGTSRSPNSSRRSA